MGNKCWKELGGMQMNEAELKGKLVKRLRKDLAGSVVFRHEDQFTAGIPDISVTWNGLTCWIEVKHVTPKKPFKATGLQIQTAKKLAKQGNCYIVVYHESKTGLLSTFIINPEKIVGNLEVEDFLAERQ